MERSRILPAFLVVASLAVFCAPIAAQTGQNASAPQPSRVRKADRRPMPFPPGSETAGPAATLEFRSYEQMSRQDRDLAADAESSIGERAGFAGLEFNQGKWSYQQIVCPALPNHLLLQFTRNNGTGDVSVFSASIPRGGDGRVRIIPILRRGYSLFSPAPINALTISAFNHIRAEEHSEQPPAWLETGLCYAALAGAHPQVGPPEETEDRSSPPRRRAAGDSHAGRRRHLIHRCLGDAPADAVDDDLQRQGKADKGLTFHERRDRRRGLRNGRRPRFRESRSRRPIRGEGDSD